MHYFKSRGPRHQHWYGRAVSRLCLSSFLGFGRLQSLPKGPCHCLSHHTRQLSLQNNRYQDIQHKYIFKRTRNRYINTVYIYQLVRGLPDFNENIIKACFDDYCIRFVWFCAKLVSDMYFFQYSEGCLLLSRLAKSVAVTRYRNVVKTNTDIFQNHDPKLTFVDNQRHIS